LRRSFTFICSSLGMLVLPSVTFSFEGTILALVTFYYMRECGFLTRAAV
jgi:hypothetical protein